MCAPGGGGALLLVLLKVHPADIYGEITTPNDIPLVPVFFCRSGNTVDSDRNLNLWQSRESTKTETEPKEEPTCDPAAWQVPRLLGALWEAHMGG